MTITQYIDKFRVVAEIERIEYETNYEPFTDEVLGKRKVCKDIKDFLDTLEVKDVDFETEWKKYFEYKGNLATVNVKDLAKHFFELGLKSKGD